MKLLYGAEVAEAWALLAEKLGTAKE